MDAALSIMTAQTIHCANCGERVEDGALFCPHCGEAIQYRVPDSDPFIGRMVSQRYTVSERLARGGMGEVYLARHAELNQRVAVKFLHRRFADDEEFATRFFNEARSACRVNHPYAVTIYDYGRLEEGTLYIVMEFVGGISLKEVIQRDGRVSVENTLRIGQQAAEVLSAAHGQAIVHRDVKPDNIMVMESSSGRPSIKMLDFGIAKILDDDSSIGSLTQTGVTFGTPEYMSPEQAAGRDVDERSDVYSLGLCLYAMLVGKPPFSGNNKLALLQRHIREAPPSLDNASGQALPAELVRLVGEMLEKDPERRPQSMDVVASRLEELQRTSSASTSGRASTGAIRRAPAAGSAPASSAHRLLTHASEGHSEPFVAPSASPGQVDTETYELGGVASPPTDGFTLGGGHEDAGESWSIGGDDDSGDFAFDDDPYAAPLRTEAPPSDGGGRALRLVAIAVVVVGLLVGANFLIRRASIPAVETPPGEAEGSGEVAVAAVDEGSGVADGSGAAVVDAPEGSGAALAAAEPEPPRDEVGERISQILTAIEEARIEEAEAILDALAAEGAGGFQAVENARNRVAAVRALMTQIERGLRSGDCRAADEKVVELQERYSRRLGMSYWGRLDECRAAQRPTPTPTPTPEPPSEPASGGGSNSGSSNSGSTNSGSSNSGSSSSGSSNSGGSSSGGVRPPREL